MPKSSWLSSPQNPAVRYLVARDLGSQAPEEQLQELKSQYLKEKVDFQHSAYQKVKRLEQRAQQEAVTCLTHHSHQVKQDNRYLKSTLLSLINENKALQGQEEKLKAQNAELRRQLELDARLSERARASPSRITITR